VIDHCRSSEPKDPQGQEYCCVDESDESLLMDLRNIREGCGGRGRDNRRKYLSSFEPTIRNLLRFTNWNLFCTFCKGEFMQIWPRYTK
jgi:hypothetical protein